MIRVISNSNVEVLIQFAAVFFVGLLVPSITFKGVELLTSNLVHRWVSVRERFGLFLSEFGSGEGGEMGG